MHLVNDAPQVNGAGQTEYGKNVVNGLERVEHIEDTSVKELSKEHDLVLKTFRLLIADLYVLAVLSHWISADHATDASSSKEGTLGMFENHITARVKLSFNSGAIGMAAIGIALWKYVMRYAPHTPTYFNRDRFILSNGTKADSATTKI